MPLDVIVGSATKDAARADVYPATTAKRVTRIEAYSGSAWKLVQSFAPPISLAASPVASFASRNAAAVVAIISDPVTAFVTGGTAPYSYLWTQTGGPAASIYSPTSASSQFAMGLGPGSSETSSFTCTATDSNGLTAAAVASVTFTNTSGA